MNEEPKRNRKLPISVIIGAILIIIQIMSISGSIHHGSFMRWEIIVSNQFGFGDKLLFLASFFAVGIVGIILVVVGLYKDKKHEK